MIEKAGDALGDLVAAEIHRSQVELIRRVTEMLNKKDTQIDATVTSAIQMVERLLMAQVRQMEKE